MLLNVTDSGYGTRRQEAGGRRQEAFRRQEEVITVQTQRI